MCAVTVVLCGIFVADINVYCFVRYLALVAALASEADWVLVPEWPPERGWEDVLCNKLAQVCSISDSVLKLEVSD